MNLYFNTPQTVFRLDSTLEGKVWYLVNGVYQYYLGDQVIAPSQVSPGFGPDIALDKVEFGDGYSQITESGINPVKMKFDLIFSKKHPDVARALQRFFIGEDASSIYYRRPSEWFYWLPPYPWAAVDSQPLRFNAERFSSKSDDYAFTCSVTFVQSFEP